MGREGILTEGQFFQRPARSLWVHEVDEQKLKRDPAAVNGQEFPVYGRESDRVHVVREETADFTEDLFDSDTAGSLGVGEELDEVGWEWFFC